MEDLALKTRNVAVNVRKLREFRAYTQDYLAAKLKISQNAYSKIELGYSKLTLERLFQIASILEIDPSHLMTSSPTDLLNIISKGDVAIGIAI